MVVSGVVNLLNPALIIVGGDLARAYDPLVAGMRELIYQRSTATATRNLRIEPSVQSEQSGVEACAAMAVDDVLSARAVDDRLSGSESR